MRRLWQRAQREHGVEAVQKAFQMTLDNLGFEEAHNMMGCCNCQWEGHEVIYCIQSQHNQDHPYHICPGQGQECC